MYVSSKEDSPTPKQSQTKSPHNNYKPKLRVALSTVAANEHCYRKEIQSKVKKITKK
jgi:hypothetical protein